MNSKYMAGFFLGLFLFSMWPSLALAEARLPTYATGENVETQINSKGKKVTDVISLVVGVISILAILIGAGYLPFNGDRARQLMIGGVVCLVIASMVYGIAKLVI